MAGLEEAVVQAVTITARIIQGLIELFKNRARKKIEKLNEEIQDLKDDAKKTGKNHKDEIEEKKGQIEKLETAKAKFENVVLSDPKYQQMMGNNINKILNDGDKRFVKDGKLTKEGLTEAAKKTIDDIAKDLGIGKEDLMLKEERIMPEMYNNSDVIELANAIKENDNVPDNIPKIVEFVYGKLNGKTAEEISSDERIVNKDLAYRILNKGSIATEHNMFYFDKKTKSFVSNPIGANPTRTDQQHEV